jgi:putative membrane protein
MKESLKFLIPLGIGMVIGILAVGEAIDFFLVRFSMQTGGFIAGLMAGSLPFIHSQCVLGKQDEKAAKPIEKKWLFAVGAAVFIIAITLLAPEGDRETAMNGATEGVNLNAALVAHLFVGGLFAAATMVIPGVSGAMVLMLFGLFPIAMHTISNIREYLTSPANFELLTEILVVVVPLGIGIVAGILLGSRLIAWLLKKYHSQTYFVILGLVFGTIFVIFNDPATYQSRRFYDATTNLPYYEFSAWLLVLTIIAFVFGMITSLLLGKRKED